MNIDTSKTYVVGFSGGKDSVATWLHLQRELNFPNVVCTFADTGHESAITYDYISLLAQEHGCPLVRIQPLLGDVAGVLQPWKICWRLGLRQFIPWAPDELSHTMEVEQERFFEERGVAPGNVEVLEGWQSEPLTMERLAIIKRRFPSPTARFCTTFLKLLPQKRWLDSTYSDLGGIVRVSGVRAEESAARALRPEWTDVDDVFGCPLWLPIHSWTHQDVFACHARHGVPPNPLYLHGCGRVGCFPCINAKKSELSAIAGRFPEAFVSLSDMENRVAGASGMPKLSFFSHGKTPRKYESNLCHQSGETFPDAEDVRLWATGEPAKSEGALPFFEEDWSEDVHQCLSQYGLCE